MSKTEQISEVELEFEEVMEELMIDEEARQSARSFLAILKQKSVQTYNHSLRVGLLARKIGRFMHLDEKALFFAGIFHDLGKSQTPLRTLHKTSGWTDEDSKIMEGHVTDSYRLLRDKFDFSAEIVLWHHRFQKNSYPVEMPESLHEYCQGTKVLIQEYGRVLAVADVYDALHRKNDKYEEGEELTGEQIREKMLEFNKDRKELIGELYNVGILERGIIPTDNPDEELYKKSWQYLPKDFNNLPHPRETARLVVLAVALEPLADKSGCTTRFTDISRHLKLEYFITGAINLGCVFEDLAIRVQKAARNAYPAPLSMIPNIYSYALRAQQESLKNRSGGRINQGIIELLIPIVTAQYYLFSESVVGTDLILKRAVDILQWAGRGNVNELILMKRFAYDLCRYNERPVSIYPEAYNIYRYYLADLASSTKPTGKAHNSEFVNGFPTVKMMYESIMNSSKKTFMKKVEEAFRHGVKMHDKDVGRGFLADCVAVAIYLCLSQHPKIQLVV